MARNSIAITWCASLMLVAVGLVPSAAAGSVEVDYSGTTCTIKSDGNPVMEFKVVYTAEVGSPQTKLKLRLVDKATQDKYKFRCIEDKSKVAFGSKFDDDETDKVKVLLNKDGDNKAKIGGTTCDLQDYQCIVDAVRSQIPDLIPESIVCANEVMTNDLSNANLAYGDGTRESFTLAAEQAMQELEQKY